MVRWVMIGRVNDGLPLCASTDEDDQSPQNINSKPLGEQYKNSCKLILRQLSGGPKSRAVENPSEGRLSVDCDGYVIHYSVENGVCCLAVCNKQYPKKLAFAFLEELQKQFYEEHAQQIDTAARPYALIKFGMIIIYFRNFCFYFELF